MLLKRRLTQPALTGGLFHVWSIPMKYAALGLALLALASVLSGCGPAGTIIYCIAVDHDQSRKCQ